MLQSHDRTPESGVGRVTRGEGDPAAAAEPRWQRDPMAWALAALAALAMASAALWVVGGGSSSAERFTGIAALPAGLLAFALCVRVSHAKRVDAATRRMWSRIGIAVLAYGLGALLHAISMASSSLGLLTPVGLGLELAAYPVVWRALSFLPGPNHRHEEAILFSLDVAIVAWSVAILIWHLILYPIGRDAGASLVDTFGAALFPAADVSLVFALVALVIRTQKSSTQIAFGVAAAALFAGLLADTIQGVEVLRGTYHAGGLSGVLYSAGTIGFAAAVYLQWRLHARIRSTRGLADYSSSIPWLPYVAVAVALVAPANRDWNDLELLRQHIPATGFLMALVVARLLVTARENSRLATAERTRLAAAVEQAGEAMLTADPTGTVTYVNPAFTRITGYSSAEAIGRNWTFIRPNPDPDRLAELMAALARGDSWDGRMDIRKSNGTEFEVAMTIAPLRDSTGAISGAVAVGRDVSRERALEARLAQAERMEAVGRLAGGIAHDFNNILTAISGFTELAATEVAEDHPVTDELREILKASDRAATLTRALLAYSRRLVMQPRRVNLNDAVTDLQPMLEVLLGEDVTLEVRPDPDLGLALIDRAQLEQVVLNLALNARDAMPDGGKVTISTANAQVDAAYARTHIGAVAGPHVKLMVADTGVGMTSEVMDHAFEPFFTTKARGKGTGLGLSTVVGIVAMSLGTMDVQSTPGSGSIFTILLPRVEGESEKEEPAAGAPLTAGRNETILIAEDEEMVRSFVQRVLSRAGYHVLAAANGNEALRIAGTLSHIDLLFTDMVMPGMGGPELGRSLSKIYPGVRILYASGYPGDAFGQDFGGSGEVPYLSKPFTSEALLTRIREVLDGQAPAPQPADGNTTTEKPEGPA
jgi:PAS domain S-box-containing protein